MSSASLVNLAPIMNIILMGLIVALGPLTWVWLKTRGDLITEAHQAEKAEQELRSRQRLLLLSQITLFLTFDLLMFGAFTRLTDSGLGCPDWPGCYGHGSPSGANAMIEGAQAIMPTGPVTHVKAWIEMIHRYLATGVGVLILTIALFTVSQKYPRALKFESLLILFWVCLQGAFGALTVTMRLFPAIVTMHLLGAVMLLILLTRFVTAQRSWVGLIKGGLEGVPSLEQNALTPQASSDQHSHKEHIENIARALRRVSQPAHQQGLTKYLPTLLGLGLMLVLIQIVLGGWVSTNYAVTACSTFPMCQNSWWPLMNFSEGFEIWRALGVTSKGEILNFESLTAIHYTHRLTAYVVFAYLSALGYLLQKEAHYKTLGQLIWVLISLQVATGISNVVFQWPLFAAVLHTGGAAALGIVLTSGLRMFRPQEGLGLTAVRQSNQTPHQTTNASYTHTSETPRGSI